MEVVERVQAATTRKNHSIVDILMVVAQVLIIPILISFNTRISDLELSDRARGEEIHNLADKINYLIKMQEQGSRDLTNFYKEYAPALEYSKREMQKR